MKCNKTRILLVDDMDINLVIGIGLVKPTWHHTLCLELELQALAGFKETSIG